MADSCDIGQKVPADKDLQTPPIRWHISPGLTDYEGAVAHMEDEVAAIRAQNASELVWLVEHPPIYTAGTSAKPEDLLDPDRFPVYRTGRGGQYTYHGPGQRVAYVMLDLKKRGSDIRKFVCDLEQWIIDTLGQFNVIGERREGRVGIWVRRQDKSGEDKIAAVGVRVRHWVSFHGISLNLEPDLSHFDGIVPCGIAEHGVTSLAKLGIIASMAELDMALRTSFERVFGPAIDD
jgi:lipoyl(octanoyl) transferase